MTSAPPLQENCARPEPSAELPVLASQIAGCPTEIAVAEWICWHAHLAQLTADVADTKHIKEKERVFL
jgi:hypothetical protein